MADVVIKSDLLEFLERLESLWLLGAALAHEETLHLGSARLLYFSDLARASSRDGPRVDRAATRDGGSRAGVEGDGRRVRRVARSGGNATR